MSGINTLEYYQKTLDVGNPNEQSMLGLRYLYGNGVEQDYKKAVEYYQTAAEQGNTGAQNRLGSCYYHGYGVEQDYFKAIALYKKVVECGSESARENLETCIKNYFEYYEKLVNNGDVDAQYILGQIYEGLCGNIKDIDYKEAYKWYQKAQAAGNKEAHKN